MKFEAPYFEPFSFSREQIRKHLANSAKDLQIARTVHIIDVQFNYAYTALLKAGIGLLSCHQVRVKPIPGHQSKIIEEMSQILKDPDVETLGQVMRAKRNKDLYGGGAEITKKECAQYLEFVEKIVEKAAEYAGLLSTCSSG